MAKNKSAINASLWSFVERLSTQVVTFIIGIVLARLLSPHDYGVVGIISIFIVLTNVFIDAGFANGLIRKIDRTEKDLSTAFYFNIVVGILAYFILILTSSFIATYFEEPILTPLIKIAGFNVVLSSLCIVQTAILTANLNIRLQTIINVISQVPAGIIAIVMAYYGSGVYSLVWQTIISSAIKTCLLWYYAKWRPKERFYKESFNYLWGFGSKLLSATLIGVFFDQIYSILIGKYIGKNELGYFSKSQHLNQNVTSISSGIVQKVGLPVLSEYQEDETLLCEKFREIMRLLVFLLAGFSAFLCFAANDIILFIWTDKWIECAVLFQFLIIGSMFSPIGQLSLILLQTKGRTGLILKLEVPKKIIYCIYLAVGFSFGVKGLAIASVFISFTAALINMWATKKVLPYSYFDQMKDLTKYMIIAYPIAFFSKFMAHTDWPIVNIMIIFFLTIVGYIGFLVVVKDKTVEFLIRKLLSYKNKYPKNS